MPWIHPGPAPGSVLVAPLPPAPCLLEATPCRAESLVTFNGALLVCSRLLTGPHDSPPAQESRTLVSPRLGSHAVTQLTMGPAPWALDMYGDVSHRVGKGVSAESSVLLSVLRERLKTVSLQREKDWRAQGCNAWRILRKRSHPQARTGALMSRIPCEPSPAAE